MEKEKKTIDYRVEKDSIGTKDVPVNLIEDDLDE